MTEQELRVREKQESTPGEGTRPGRSFVPDVDIYETADALHLRADMPGVDERSITVHLDNHVLSLEGQVTLDDYADMGPVYTEYNVGPWVRRFTVSDAIAADRIEARIVNGVLELTLPKSDRVKPRKIAVSTN
jgi:HSP20 family protein